MPSMAAQKPKNNGLAQFPCCWKSCQLCCQRSDKLVAAQAQRINRVRVNRCNTNMARATLAESVMPKRLRMAKITIMAAVTIKTGRIGSTALR